MNKKNLLLAALMMVAVFTLSACNKPIDPEKVPDAQASEGEAQMGMPAEGSEVNEMVAQKDRYEINIEASTLGWSAGKIVGHNYTGKVPVKSGFLTAAEGEFIGGEFVIDMPNMTIDQEGKEGVIKHLKNADFFNVEKYPTSTFKITSIEPVGDEYRVTGDLTILEATNEIQFMAKMEEVEGQVKANAQFEIDRTKWGIEFQSESIFAELGDKAIKDKIGYSLELYFQ